MAYLGTIKIASGTVAADLTNFPVMIRLSDMPAEFWAAVKSDGGDIRIKTTGGTQIPQDLVRFDYSDSDGVIFFKDTVYTGSDNLWNISCGYPALEKIADDNANGRNAVWSDYESVFMFGETCGDDRTGKAMAYLYMDPESFVRTATSPDVNSHNGVCWDGTYYYTFADIGIIKYDASWNVVATNSDVITAAGLGSPYNHISDGDVHGGYLYFFVGEYPDDPPTSLYLCKFLASDLSYVSKADQSALSIGPNLCYCDKDDLLYAADYQGSGSGGSALYKFNPSTLAYVGTTALSVQIYYQQGITWWKDHFWISTTVDPGVVRVRYDGTVQTGDVGAGYNAAFGGNADSGAEGCGHLTDELLWLCDPGNPEVVYTYKGLDIDLCAGGGMAVWGNAERAYATGRSTYATFTLGCTGNMDSKPSHAAGVASYWDTAIADKLVMLAWRNSTSIGWGIWDKSNSWLMSNPLIDPTLDQSYRLHAVYDGTALTRKLYVDGALSNTGTGITTVTSLDAICAGSANATSTNALDGYVGYVYLRPAVLSADWIAAEYANINDPDTFYDIGGVISPESISSEESFGNPILAGGATEVSSYKGIVAWNALKRIFLVWKK